MMRTQRALGFVLLAGVATFAACGSDDASGPTGAADATYGFAELTSGVPVDVDDPSGAVDSAMVLLANGLPSILSLHPQLEESGVAVMNPGERGYDVVVVYRTGPFCGLLPAVSIHGDVDQLSVEVISTPGDDCDDAEYDGAVGFDLADEFEQADVTATHQG